VAKSQERGIDAVVIALTALERLGLENQVAEIFDPEVMIPQVGQGAFGVECRSDDEVAIEVLRVVNDQDAQRTVTAERSFLAGLGAGCSVPVGAWATTHGDDVFIRAMLASPDGHEILRTTATGKDPEQLGAAVAAQLRDELGGARIISSWHRPTTG
jgi:hydroxymethylbilane synthase